MIVFQKDSQRNVKTVLRMKFVWLGKRCLSFHMFFTVFYSNHKLSGVARLLQYEVIYFHPIRCLNLSHQSPPALWKNSPKASYSILGRINNLKVLYFAFLYLPPLWLSLWWETFIILDQAGMVWKPQSHFSTGSHPNADKLIYILYLNQSQQNMEEKATEHPLFLQRSSW